MTDSWTDRLSDYVDGELDAKTHAALEAHLATCASCRATRDELQRVVARARGLAYREPAKDLWGAIESSIATHAPRSSRRLVTVSWAGLAAAAAIVGAPAPPAGVTLAVASYREAAADLQRAFEAGRSTLRPETMRVIEENLRTIDLAIAHVRLFIARSARASVPRIAREEKRLAIAQGMHDGLRANQPARVIQ